MDIEITPWWDNRGTTEISINLKGQAEIAVIDGIYNIAISLKGIEGIYTDIKREKLENVQGLTGKSW